MPDPVITQRTVHVEHIKIESSKLFSEVKAALDELVPPLDPTIPEALRQGDIARANEALQRGPELAIFSARDHGGLLRIAGVARKARAVRDRQSAHGRQDDTIPAAGRAVRAAARSALRKRGWPCGFRT